MSKKISTACSAFSCATNPSWSQTYVQYALYLSVQLEILTKGIFLMTFTFQCHCIIFDKWYLLRVYLNVICYFRKTLSTCIRKADDFIRFVTSPRAEAQWLFGRWLGQQMWPEIHKSSTFIKPASLTQPTSVLVPSAGLRRLVRQSRVLSYDFGLSTKSSFISWQAPLFMEANDIGGNIPNAQVMWLEGGKQALMEKGPKASSLPIAILELLVFLWNSWSVVIAKWERATRVSDMQITRSLCRRHIHADFEVRRNGSCSGVGKVAQSESNAAGFLYFSVSRRAPCISNQTPQKGSTAVPLGHRACSDMYKVSLCTL